MPLLRCACRVAGALLITFTLGACSYNVQTQRLQDSPPAGIPLSHELTETPFFPQERYQCGPAAMATVLGSGGVAVEPDELTPKVYLPARQGSVPVEMEAAARSYGMLVYPLGEDLSTLLTEVAAGHPVLLLQNLGLSWMPRWHYAVLVGYDLGEGSVVLRSGTTRRYRVSMALLETTWQRGGYWARLVLPPATIPTTAEPLAYTRSALALEQSRQPQAALQSYRAATGRWPDSSVAWLARGNLAYSLERYTEAEQSFRGGLAASPRNADLWNNLGYALSARGCRARALEAVSCAVSLAPEKGAFRDSLRELEAKADGGNHCEPVACPAVGH